MNAYLESAARAIALGGTTLLAAGAAQAQEPAGGWYVEGGLTWSMPKDSAGTIANAAFPGVPPTTLYLVNSVDDGWGGQLAFGYRSGRLRVEAEVGQTRNDGDSYTTLRPVQVTRPQDASFDVTRYMINTHLDLAENRWNPYLGFGAGWADVTLYAFGRPAPAPPTVPPMKMIDGSDTVLAYQFIAGIAYDFNPKLALTVRYRWFEAADAETVDMRGERISRETSGHNLDFGLRYRF